MKHVALSPLAVYLLTGCSEDRLQRAPQEPDRPTPQPTECGPLECEEVPECIPPQTFEPVVKWEWQAGDNQNQLIMSPVVIRFSPLEPPKLVVATFDQIDVWSTPDSSLPGRLQAIDGATGQTVTDFAPTQVIEGGVTPVAADLDGDSVPEIVTMKYHGAGITNTFSLYAFHIDGSLMWESDTFTDTTHAGYTLDFMQIFTGPSVADLEGDGSPEVIVGSAVFNADGSLRWQGTLGTGQAAGGHFSAAADLDGDGELEVVTGNTAYAPDGQVVWHEPSVVDGGVAIADCDLDGLPEIFVAGTVVNGGFTNPADPAFSILEHDGTPRVLNHPAISSGTIDPNWPSTPAAADIDGDGMAEWAVSFQGTLAVIDCDGNTLWTKIVTDASGVAGPSMFDFEGDGKSEVIFNDEVSLRIFRGEDGTEIYNAPRQSGTGYETPVVADIDADGHADLVVVSDSLGLGGGSGTVHAYSNTDNNWAATYRLWNQHGFHVTNLNEDSSVPLQPVDHWLGDNVFRGNATFCRPAQ